MNRSFTFKGATTSRIIGTRFYKKSLFIPKFPRVENDVNLSRSNECLGRLFSPRHRDELLLVAPLQFISLMAGALLVTRTAGRP